MKLKVPLSEQDAFAIRHTFETRCIALSDADQHYQPGDYGRAIGWIENLLAGAEVEINDDELKTSRAIFESRKGDAV
jgi:hypothetical protein